MGNTKQYIENVVTGYVDTLLWTGWDWTQVCEDDEDTCVYDHSQCEVNPTNMDDNFDEGNIALEAMEEIREDVEGFLSLALDIDGADTIGAEQMGRDFCLTRNGHGAGFWDRGLGELGDKLTDAAKTYGEQELYVGDDGVLYV